MTQRPGDVLRAMADSYAMISRQPLSWDGSVSIERTIARETMRICVDSHIRALRDVATVFDAQDRPTLCMRMVGPDSSVCMRPFGHAEECG